MIRDQLTKLENDYYEASVAKCNAARMAWGRVGSKKWWHFFYDPRPHITNSSIDYDVAAQRYIIARDKYRAAVKEYAFTDKLKDSL
jgi:hypothetical protein